MAHPSARYSHGEIAERASGEFASILAVVVLHNSAEHVESVVRACRAVIELPG